MGGELSLATAVAISGAAVSPNMGSKTPSAALALFLSLFNLRLGFWAPTPSGRRWNEPYARLWPFYVLRETLSNTGQIGTYCYLTDGGHFDNTGLYALVERGCRYIVVCDCGANPELGFEDIGVAIRRCRIDFGAEIDLSIDGSSTRARRTSCGGPSPINRSISRCSGSPGSGPRRHRLDQAGSDGGRRRGRPAVSPGQHRFPAAVHGGPVVRREPVRELSSARIQSARAAFANLPASPAPQAPPASLIAQAAPAALGVPLPSPGNFAGVPAWFDAHV